MQPPQLAKPYAVDERSLSAMRPIPYDAPSRLPALSNPPQMPHTASDLPNSCPATLPTQPALRVIKPAQASTYSLSSGPPTGTNLPVPDEDTINIATATFLYLDRATRHVPHIATMQDPFKRVLSLLDHLMGQDDVQTTHKLACTRCSGPLALFFCTSPVSILHLGILPATTSMHAYHPFLTTPPAALPTAGA
jgi:hypothetical protein